MKSQQKGESSNSDYATSEEDEKATYVIKKFKEFKKKMKTYEIANLDDVVYEGTLYSQDLHRGTSRKMREMILLMLTAIKMMTMR